MAKIEKIISICARAIHEWSPIFWVIFDPPPISDFPPKLKRNVQYLILILETFRFYPFRYDFALGIIWFQKKCLTFFFHHPWLWVYGQKNELYLYWWSKCAFSILLSFALLFWNQILIWVSVKFKVRARLVLSSLDKYLSKEKKIVKTNNFHNFSKILWNKVWKLKFVHSAKITKIY